MRGTTAFSKKKLGKFHTRISNFILDGNPWEFKGIPSEIAFNGFYSCSNLSNISKTRGYTFQKSSEKKIGQKASLGKDAFFRLRDDLQLCANFHFTLGHNSFVMFLPASVIFSPN